MKTIKITREGKLTIPQDIRKEIGLSGEEKYVLVTDDGDLILKKISKDRSRQKMKDLIKGFQKSFRNAKITKKDIAEAIKAAKTEKAK